MTAEEWRPIPGFPGYEVSSHGRVKSYKRQEPRILKGCPDHGGYPRVRLMRTSGVPANRGVHVLVATTFLGPKPDGHEVRHLDGTPSNNSLTNLAWGTRSENVQDAIRHGTHSELRKTHCPKGHPYDEANTRVSPRGHRRCRTCLSRRVLLAA